MPNGDTPIGWDRSAQDEAETQNPPALTPADTRSGGGRSAVVLVLIVVVAVLVLLVVLELVLPGSNGNGQR